ncbi:MAG TPA: WD40 repeat domain-containing protein [Aggregatilineaceae bacterium]|nr:WD40 repeat domain-containing protein [Aggregatilineaceae bacterium]
MSLEKTCSNLVDDILNTIKEALALFVMDYYQRKWPPTFLNEIKEALYAVNKNRQRELPDFIFQSKEKFLKKGEITYWLELLDNYKVRNDFFPDPHNQQLYRDYIKLLIAYRNNKSHSNTLNNEDALHIAFLAIRLMEALQLVEAANRLREIQDVVLRRIFAEKGLIAEKNSAEKIKESPNHTSLPVIQAALPTREDPTVVFARWLDEIQGNIHSAKEMRYKVEDMLKRLQIFVSAPSITPSSPPPQFCSEIAVLNGHQGHKVTCLAFSRDSVGLMSGSEDRTIQLWTRYSRRMIKFGEHDRPVRSIGVHPHEDIVASGSDDPILRLWKLGDRRVFRELKKHQAPIASLAFAPDGSKLACVHSDGFLVVWMLNDWSRPGCITLNESVNDAFFLTFSPDGSSLACAYENVIQLWQFPNRRPQSILDNGVRCVKFSPDGTLLASASEQGVVKVWRWDKRQVNLLTRCDEPIVTVDFSPDNDWLAAGLSDGRLLFWQLPYSNGSVPFEFQAHRSPIRTCVFSPDATLLATGTQEGEVKVWEIKPDLI